MTPGPKPKPAEVAEAQGNPGHRAIVKTSTDVPTIAAEPPIALSDRGREIWASVVTSARALGFMKLSDGRALARYCDHMDRWLKVRARVDEKGESYETDSKHGKMQRINPDFNVMMRLEERMIAIEDRLGLTPAARQSILLRYRPEEDHGDSLFPSPATPAAGTAPAPQNTGPQNPLGMFAPTGRPN